MNDRECGVVLPRAPVKLSLDLEALQHTLEVLVVGRAATEHERKQAGTPTWWTVTFASCVLEYVCGCCTDRFSIVSTFATGKRCLTVRKIRSLAQLLLLACSLRGTDGCPEYASADVLVCAVHCLPLLCCLSPWH